MMGVNFIHLEWYPGARGNDENQRLGNMSRNNRTAKDHRPQNYSRQNVVIGGILRIIIGDRGVSAKPIQTDGSEETIPSKAFLYDLPG